MRPLKQTQVLQFNLFIPIIKIFLFFFVFVLQEVKMLSDFKTEEADAFIIFRLKSF